MPRITLVCHKCGKEYMTYSCWRRAHCRHDYCSRKCSSEAKVGWVPPPDSPETRARKSAASKRKWLNPEYRAKLLAALSGENNPMFGRKYSEERKAKQSIRFSGAGNPFFGKTHTPEVRAIISRKIRSAYENPQLRMRERIAAAQRGVPNSAEHNAKIAEHSKRMWQDAEIRNRIISSMTGERHWNWRGGPVKYGYSKEWRAALKREIRERDGFVCQVCGKEQGDELLSVHHIDYDKKNSCPANLVSLCRGCHSRTTDGDRDLWRGFFAAINQRKLVACAREVAYGR